jgi:hypothetical protein
MISNQTIFDLDSIRDHIDVLRKLGDFGYSLKMKIELIEDKLVEFTRNYMGNTENEAKWTSPEVELLYMAFSIFGRAKKSTEDEEGDSWYDILDMSRQYLAGASYIINQKMLDQMIRQNNRELFNM